MTPGHGTYRTVVSTPIKYIQTKCWFTVKNCLCVTRISLKITTGIFCRLRSIWTICPHDGAISVLFYGCFCSYSQFPAKVFSDLWPNNVFSLACIKRYNWNVSNCLNKSKNYKNNFMSNNKQAVSFQTRMAWYIGCKWLIHEPLTRYVKSRFAHAPGMPGAFSPPPTIKETDS